MTSSLKELTNGLSEQILYYATTPDTTELMRLGQKIFTAVLETRQGILAAEQTIEEQEADILVAVASDNSLSNELKRKAAKQALANEDAILVEAKYKKARLEEQLAALEFTASQCRSLVRLLPSVTN